MRKKKTPFEQLKALYRLLSHTCPGVIHSASSFIPFTSNKLQHLGKMLLLVVKILHYTEWLFAYRRIICLCWAFASFRLRLGHGGVSIKWLTKGLPKPKQALRTVTQFSKTGFLSHITHLCWGYGLNNELFIMFYVFSKLFVKLKKKVVYCTFKYLDQTKYQEICMQINVFWSRICVFRLKSSWCHIHSFKGSSYSIQLF